MILFPIYKLIRIYQCTPFVWTKMTNSRRPQTKTENREGQQQQKTNSHLFYNFIRSHNKTLQYCIWLQMTLELYHNTLIVLIRLIRAHLIKLLAIHNAHIF